MRFSTITPSFRSAQWLKLCIASVADQAVEHEHIVQDNCSDDSTGDWLPKDARVKAFIEKDEGMYDAINRGLRRATGDLVAYLNCDEQYLPGALVKVQECFAAHPEAQVIFAHTVIIDPQGQYMFHRKATIPLKYHTIVNGVLCTFSASTFFRRSLLEEHGLYFSSQFRALGDAEWVIRVLAARVKIVILPAFTSAYTITGYNMSDLANARRETAEMKASAPQWARRCGHLFKLANVARKAFHGAYSQKPFSYSIYTAQSPGKRIVFQVHKPTQKWWDKPRTPDPATARFSC